MFAKKISSRKLTLYIVFVIMLAHALTLLLPLYYMLNNSLKTTVDFLESGPWKLPLELNFANYAEVIKISGGRVPFPQMFLNSFILTGAAVTITTITTTMTAYVLARYRFRGRDFLVAVGVGSLVIPDLGSSSVVYKLYMDLNILDTWFILIRYTTPFGIGFLVLYSMFKTISNSYVEAAAIDGASDLFIFLRVCLPMARGAIGAMAVIFTINCWNDYYTPYLYLPSVKTLSVGLQEMAMIISQLKRPVLFAGMVIAVTPILILFILMRDTIIENTVAGGLKG